MPTLTPRQQAIAERDGMIRAELWRDDLQKTGRTMTRERAAAIAASQGEYTHKHPDKQQQHAAIVERVILQKFGIE